MRPPSAALVRSRRPTAQSTQPLSRESQARKCQKSKGHGLSDEELGEAALRRGGLATPQSPDGLSQGPRRPHSAPGEQAEGGSRPHGNHEEPGFRPMHAPPRVCVRACVRACHVCGAAGTRQGCASRTERGWRRGRRAPQRVAWTRSLREQRPCPQAPVTAGGAAPGAAGSRSIFPPTRPKGRLQPQSRLQAAGPPLCPAVPGKGHEAGHHQRQHGAGGASPPPG